MKTIAIFMACLLSMWSGSRYLPWAGSQQLEWEHFSGPADPDSPWTALTVSRLDIRWTWEQRALQFSVDALFDTERSWRKSDDFPNLLAHEQLHFDIAELHARRMRKHFADLPAGSLRTDDEVRAHVAELRAAWSAAEKQYDAETDHSRDRAAQARWEAKVQRELRALAQYAQP